MVRFIGYIYIYSMDFHDKNIYNTEQVVFFRIHKIIFYLWFVTKKPTGLDGNLNTISLFMDLSGSLVLHIRLHLLVKFIHICLVPSLLLVDVWKPSKLLKGGGSEKLRIINTLAPGAKFCKPLVKRDLQAFNGYSFIIFTVSFKMHPTNEFYS